MTERNKSHRQSRLLKLQVREYIARYHPDMSDVSIEIKPGNTIATVRKKRTDDAEV